MKPANEDYNAEVVERRKIHCTSGVSLGVLFVLDQPVLVGIRTRCHHMGFRTLQLERPSLKHRRDSTPKPS